MLRKYTHVLIASLEDQTLLGSEPLPMCCYNNIGSKRTLHPDVPYVQKIGTLICSPYPTRQLSKSWHALDGVLPTMKGRANHMIYSLNQWVPAIKRFCEFINSGWPSQHMTSALIIIMTKQNCSRSSSKKHNKVMIQITLQVIIIGLQKTVSQDCTNNQDKIGMHKLTVWVKVTFLSYNALRAWS